jgi:hypothetical protein
MPLLSRIGGQNPIARHLSGAPAAPSISYRAAPGSASDLSTYTFSGVSIGTAGANRHVIVGIMSLADNLGVTGISSVTIGGVTATTQVAVNDTATGSFSALVIAAVPTGTTGDVVVNMTTTQARLRIGVWAAYDLTSPTAVTTNQSKNANPSVLNINTQAGDIVVGVGFNNTASSVSWTGATERFDASLEGANESGADHVATTAESPRTLSLAWTSYSRNSAVSAAWR